MLKFRTLQEAGGGLWRAYEAGEVITRTGTSPLLRMAMGVEVKQLGSKDSRVLRFIASTEVEDRDGDIIRVAGWDLKNFLANPVHLWAHNMRADNPPIGKTIRIEQQDARLINDVDFFMADTFELAALALKAHLAGVGAESVGFRPMMAIERRDGQGRLTGFEFQQQELLEISSVPVPSNPEALTLATQKGLLTADEATTIEKVWSPETVSPIKIYLPQSDLTEPPAKEPTVEERRQAEVAQAKAAAETMAEDEQKAMQRHHLAMAEAYGLQVTIETGEDKAKQQELEALKQEVQALSQRLAARDGAIGRAVKEAVQHAVN